MKSKVYYAIGDIHGEVDKLNRLHSLIRRRHIIDFPNSPYTLVHLGDYIDRGPDSFGVIDALMKLETDSTVSVINLKGNHEQLMEDAFNESKANTYDIWLNNGGDKTLDSYRKASFEEPPTLHLLWLSQLKTYHWDAEAKLIFVHAGLDPLHFPNDGKDRHLWTRSRRFFDTQTWPENKLRGCTVVHGHTPTRSGIPDIDGDFRRINVDTGACYGGNLTAVVLAPGQTARFLVV